MFHNENKNVETCPGIVLWDGITQPGQDAGGATVHSIKIAIPVNAVEKPELEQLATAQLNAGQFKGAMPPGGEWPLRDIDMTKFADDTMRLQGHISINANTRMGAPAIFDVNGQQLGAIQYGPMLYPGAVVKLLVHCYDFNNKSRGLAFGLDGIQIVDANPQTAPRLNVGGGMSSAAVAAAFGAGAPAVTTGQLPATPPAVTPPVTPHTGFVTGAGSPPIPPAAPATPAMAPGCPYTYEALKAAGWSDDQMRASGYLL